MGTPLYYIIIFLSMSMSMQCAAPNQNIRAQKYHTRAHIQQPTQLAPSSGRTTA